MGMKWDRIEAYSNTSTIQIERIVETANTSTIFQHIMKSRLFLLDTEQIHMSSLYYKKKNLAWFNQILCTEKLQSSTSFRIWSLFMLFRHKYPRGEGSRHSSFLSFFKGFFLSFQGGQCAIPKEKPKAIAFSAISFSRNLEGKSNLGKIIIRILVQIQPFLKFGVDPTSRQGRATKNEYSSSVFK